MLKLYNTLTKQTQEVKPLVPGVVKMYTCGPTVYRDAHVGNLRSYLMADWIRRALELQGLSVRHVKNITDVGHMRQEMLEQGEDKVIAAAIAKGKTPQQIAKLYTERFLADEQKLNILPAHHFPIATEHIEEMITVVEHLVDRGYAYEVKGNVYFKVSEFTEYGKLSGNTQGKELRESIRIEADPLKRDPRDFTLWKQAEAGRELKWPSPWGEGFPGWHIECSAMSIKYLGDKFDIHTGGVDNIFPHHEGEIAQSEGFTSRRVVSLWVHGQHLLADGVKMSKSTGNSFIIADIETLGIDPLAFRYLCLTARFGTRMNFTFTSLKAAQRALLRLRNRVWAWQTLPKVSQHTTSQVKEQWKQNFMKHVSDNLDMPGALALTWKLVRSYLPEQLKLDVLHTYDQLLGLGLSDISKGYSVPESILSIVERRGSLRRHARYDEADVLRAKLDGAGYVVQDTHDGTRVRPKSTWEKHEEAWPTISSPAEVPSLVHEPDGAEVSIAVVASNYVDDVRRCIESALRWASELSVEVVAVDNGSTDGTPEWLERAASNDPRVRVVHTDHLLGSGAANNILLKQSRGRTIIMLDTSVEVLGDIFGPIQELLDDATVGVTGPFGLRSSDLHHFHEGEGEAGDMDAMQGYCFAFKRNLLKDVGMMRESFRFYRNLDIDYSFHFKAKGYRIVADPTLPIQRHEHRGWAELSEQECDELSRKNYGRFLHKWRDRADLLIASQTAR